MAIERNITVGNVLSMATTVVGLAAVLVSLALAYGELKTQDEKFALRIERLEVRQQQNDRDHDLLIEIKTTLQALSQKVEAALAPPQRRAAGPDPLRVP